MKNSHTVPAPMRNRLLFISIVVLLTLLCSSFASAQTLFGTIKERPVPVLSDSESGLTAREAVAIAEGMLQDSLPGAYLFQMYGRETFWDNDYENPAPEIWPAPTGRAAEWMAVFIAENQQEAMIFIVTPEGVVETNRMILADIPEEQLPPVPLDSLMPFPPDFADNITALSTALGNGMQSYIDMARLYPGYEISYNAIPFWFEFPEIMEPGADPFWFIELEFGEWNERENRYEYTLVSTFINAINGDFITMLVEEGVEEPRPFVFEGSTPADGTADVPLQTTVSFHFSNTAYLPTFEFSPMYPSPFFGVFPAEAIDIQQVRPGEDHLTVHYDVTHQPDTDYTWILVSPGSVSGSILERPEVVTYSTAPSLSANTVSGQLTFRNQPSGFFKQGVPDNLHTAMSPNQEGLFNRVIVALIEPEMMEEFYGNINELPIRYAAVPDAHTGAFTIPHVADGEYLLGAVMYEIAYGYPFMIAMGNYGTQGEPILVVVEGASLTGKDFDITGYIPGLSEKADAESTSAIARSYMATMEYDARLLAMGTYEMFSGTHAKPFGKAVGQRLRIPSDGAETFPTGTAYEWWFVFHEQPAENIHLLTVFDGEVVSHDTLPVAELDEEDLPAIPLEDMRELPVQFINSVEIAEIIRHEKLDAIRFNAPHYLWMEVDYEMADLWWEYPDLTTPETGVFWVVEVYASYMNVFGTYISHEMVLLFDAVTGQPLGERIETSTPRDTDLPVKVELSQNFPNPFNPSTGIRYELPEAGDVRLQVFDMTGRLVATLTDSRMEAGTHLVTFHAGNLASGVYMYRLEAAGTILTRKMTLIK